MRELVLRALVVLVACVSVLGLSSPSRPTAHPAPTDDPAELLALMELQVRLRRAGYSPGLIDGRWSEGSRIA